MSRLSLDLVCFMLGRFLHLVKFCWRGRCSAWLALVGQFISVVGLPMPAPAVGAKDLSTPFPCQHRACGCMSASDCFKSCCCFSAGERVAWAREHDVAPPVELVDEAQHETECDQCPGSQSPTQGCCAKKKPAPAAVCEIAKSSASRWLLAFEARRCQGHDSGAATSAVAVPPLPPTTWQFDWSACGELGSATFALRHSSCEPQPPPPRCC